MTAEDRDSDVESLRRQNRLFLALALTLGMAAMALGVAWGLDVGAADDTVTERADAGEDVEAGEDVAMGQDTEAGEDAFAQETAVGLVGLPDDPAYVITPEEAAEADSESGEQDGVHIGRILDMRRESGDWVLEIDYVQWLTGEEAEEAAAAAGEAGLPNGYYVMDEDDRAYTLQVRASLITMIDWAPQPGGALPELVPIDLFGYEVWVEESNPGADQLQDALYWVEVTDGAVTAMTQQYRP